MRSIRNLAAGTLLLLAAEVHAQSFTPSDTAVTADTQVRCGPSPVYYATQTLPRGTPVRVVAEKDGGWMAIDPPNGSFSWINGRLLGENNGKTAVVLSPEAPVLAGSSLLDRQPDVVATKLPRGSQVVILGEPRVLADGSKWWPILPQKEMRYLPKDVVAAKSAVEAVSKPAVGPAPGAVIPPATIDPLWTQAEQAREAGRIAEARQLYETCLRQPHLDDSTRWRCLERLQQMGAGVKVANQPASQPSSQQVSSPYSQPAYQPPPAPAPVPPPAPTGDFRPPAGVALGPIPPAPAPAGNQGTAVGYGPRPTEAASSQSAGPGYLRRAWFPIDGKQAYALEDSQGQLLMYVTAQGSLNLDAYIGKNVSLAGSIVYHNQLRKDYILATQVMPLP